MWFEILPSAGIIVAFMALPTYAIYGLHKLTLGNPYRRNMDERFSRVMYLRDRRITGNPYVMSGLEAVPDEPAQDEGNC